MHLDSTCEQKPKTVVKFDVAGVELTPGQYEVMQKVMEAQGRTLPEFIRDSIMYCLQGHVELDFAQLPKIRDALVRKLKEAE